MNEFEFFNIEISEDDHLTTASQTVYFFVGTAAACPKTKAWLKRNLGIEVQHTAL